MTPDPRRSAASSRTDAAPGPPRELMAPDAPELDFSIEGADVVEHAASPTLGFDLHVDAGDASIRSLSLNVQIRIEATARDYGADEKERLFELFGAPGDWGRNLRGLLWAQTSLVVPAFQGATRRELSLPCTYDFDVSAAKYLHAVRDGTVPLSFLFSGTVFYSAADAPMRAIRLPWDREARFRMPAGRWHELMDQYFPGSAWLRLRRDVFDRLHAFRTAHGLPGWEATLEELLDRANGGSEEVTG